MIRKDILKLADATVWGALKSEGFSRKRPGIYRRTASEGRDRADIDMHAEWPRFGVMLGYGPAWLDEVLSLDEKVLREPPFFCPPYVTPQGMSRMRYEWVLSGEADEAVLQEVATSVRAVGLPWLKRLRDPELFAAEVDPMSLLVLGFSNEYVGNLKKAREAYSRLVDRLVSIGDDASIARSRPQTFVFVASKVGALPQRVERVRLLARYAAIVAPLGK